LYNTKTKIIVNNLEIVPVTVTSGAYEYPQDLDKKITSIFKYIQFIDAESIAKKVGSIRTANVVLIGALSHYLPLEEELFIKAIRNSVKSNYIDMNIDAFHEGREAVKLL
jgi:indolepyruvate ferredoxin oxidoreductase beta subunit